MRTKSKALSPHSQKVLDLLGKSQKPLSAYEILDKLRKHGIKAPPTIYRALDTLLLFHHLHNGIAILRSDVNQKHVRYSGRRVNALPGDTVPVGHDPQHRERARPVEAARPQHRQLRLAERTRPTRHRHDLGALPASGSRQAAEQK